MNSSVGASEHWTVTGERVVITGSEHEINAIVADLEITQDTIIKLGGSRAAVALWGPALTRYMNAYPDPVHDQRGARNEQADVLIFSSVV